MKYEKAGSALLKITVGEVRGLTKHCNFYLNLGISFKLLPLKACVRLSEESLLLHNRPHEGWQLYN